jgi:serine/threonine protein kinase
MALLYFKQIVKAVMYCHSNNVFHRDLKPANIVVKDDICKLIDFGMATESEPCTKKVGTIGYIPNEVFQKNPIYSCIKADIYALGIIFVYLLTGKHFFTRPDNEDVQYRKKYVENVNDFWKNYVLESVYFDQHSKKLLHDFRDVIDGMLMTNPEQRLSIDQIIKVKLLFKKLKNKSKKKNTKKSVKKSKKKSKKKSLIREKMMTILL